MAQDSKGFYHPACGKYFKHYDGHAGNGLRAQSLLDHPCEMLTAERVANWRAWQIHDLIAEINARAAELKNGNSHE